MSEETVDDRRLVAVRIKVGMWSELDRFRKLKKWTWQTLIEDILEKYVATIKSSGGK